MVTPNTNGQSVTRWRRRRTMAKLGDHSLSAEKRLAQLYPNNYPEMVPISPGVIACREADDEKFNAWLYEHRAQLETLRAIS